MAVQLSLQEMQMIIIYTFNLVKNKNNNIEEIPVYMSVRIFFMLCCVSFIFLMFCNKRNF